MAPALDWMKRAGNKLGTESWRAAKRVYHVASMGRRSPQTRLFVLGCQRSGTTLMMRIFEKDVNTSVYHEHSRLSSQDRIDGLRLNPRPAVKKALDRDPASFLILKPLVESQNASALLDYFPEAKALWMYRHYVDVAASNLKRFGLKNGIRNIRFIAQKDAQNWRSEHVSDAVREVILRHFAEDMNPYDAAALFWYARNTLYYEQALDRHERVMICRYADLASHPFQTVAEIYRFVQQPFPGAKIVDEVSSSSVGKGKQIDLSPDVERLCADLLRRLDQTYESTASYRRIQTAAGSNAAASRVEHAPGAEVVS